MKRFFNEDPDDQNFLSSEENEEQPLQAEFTAYINTEDFMNAMNMDLAQMQLNQQLLVLASELARKGDWLWCFRSTGHQEEKIERFYITLLEISEKLSEMSNMPEEGEGEENDADL